MHTPPAVPVLIESLEDFAARIFDLQSNPDLDWAWRPDESSWSLTEVMCHLRDVEREVHLVRYKSVITQDNPFLSGVSSDDWAATRGYRTQDGREAAVTFLSLRWHSLELLRALVDEQWQRTGTHAFFGTTTLQELTNLAVEHDQAHWQQIQELLAEQI